MLPPKNRLQKRSDFAQTFSKGAYVGYDGLSIKYVKNSLVESRIGFPIGKNYSKKAVTRNRTRRILREACAVILDNLKPGHDIIILIRPDYQKIEFQDIVAKLNIIFRKANLLI